MEQHKTEEYHTEKIIKPITQKIFNQKVLNITRFQTGWCHYVYDVKLESKKKIVIRISIKENLHKLKGSIYRHQKLKNSNIVVPDLIYKNTACDTYPLAFTISQRLPGTDLGNIIENLNDQQLNNIAKKVAHIQKKIAKRPLGAGYGELTSYDDKKHSITRMEFISKKLAKSKKNIKNNQVFDISYIDKVEDLLNSYKDILNIVSPIPFFDDLTSKNVLIAEGRISGIVDFDTITFGDRRFWLGLCYVAFSRLKKQQYVEYLINHLGYTKEDKKIINLYSLLFCLDFMGEIGQKFNKDKPHHDDEKQQMLVILFNRLYGDFL